MRRKALGMLALLLVCLQAGTLIAQARVHVVVVNEVANIRITPALGAEVIDSVNAGHEFFADARSPDNEWLRIDYGGFEGWINVAVLVVLEGDVNALPVADPRSIPYGGFESPRAGQSSAIGPGTARITNNVRVRAGPSTGYPVLANLFHNTLVSLTGRTVNNAWLQVSFDGVLGWIYSSYLEIQGGFNINALPVDGIVADGPPLSERGAEDYVATLRLMLARIDIAQGSLDRIRASWTDAALNGRAICQAYPPRPSDMHIANPVLAANYGTLQPLLIDFNQAMTLVRNAIDVFIEVCNLPGTGNPVGAGTVQGALGVVNQADGMFADIRRRLLELIPPELEPGPNECLISYNGRVDILPVIVQNVVYFDSFEPDDYTDGYCFDAAEGQILVFETLQLEGSNIIHFLASSPLDNPTNFIAVGRASGLSLRVGPVTVPRTGRYLLILTDLSTDSLPMGNFAFAVINATNTTVTSTLTIDPVTSQVVLGAPAEPTPDPSGQVGSPGGQPTVSCPSISFTCNQLFTCEEARACLFEGNTSLDPDGNGVPCQETLCSAEL